MFGGRNLFICCRFPPQDERAAAKARHIEEHMQRLEDLQIEEVQEASAAEAPVVSTD